MALVVVDTTALVDTWTCDSAHWRALFLKADAGEVRIGIPEVVLREFERQYLSRARTDLEDLRRADGRVRKLLPQVAPAPTSPDTDEEQQLAIAFNEVRLRLLGHAELLPLPGVSHETLLDADLGRRKPFNKKGKGYRDALIWHSLLEAAAAGPEIDVWLVSNNVEDFGLEKDGLTMLAPDLVQQAEDAGIRSVRLSRNLKSLIEALADYRPPLRPEDGDLEFIDDLPRQGKEDAIEEAAIDVARTYLSELDFEPDQEMRYGSPDSRDEFGIPLEIEAVTIDNVEIESASCDLVDDKYEDAELWNVTVRATLSLSGFAAKWDWAEIEDSGNFWVDDSDWNDKMMLVAGEVVVEAHVSVLIDSALYVLGTDVESVVAA